MLLMNLYVDRGPWQFFSKILLSIFSQLVHLSFRSAKQLNPAAKVSLKMKGKPKSYCGYNVVDKSVDLVPNPNKVTELKLTDLKEKLAESRIFNGGNAREDKCSNANLLYRYQFYKLFLS